jgi:putative ATP-dependent endonuclease of OLD family
LKTIIPQGTPNRGPKPDRALAALELVPNGDIARNLSTPIAAERESELMEICANLFTNI